MLERTHRKRLPDALLTRLRHAEDDLARRIEARDRRLRHALDGRDETRSDPVRKRLSWLLSGIRKHRRIVEGPTEEAL